MECPQGLLLTLLLLICGKGGSSQSVVLTVNGNQDSLTICPNENTTIQCVSADPVSGVSIRVNGYTAVFTTQSSSEPQGNITMLRNWTTSVELSPSNNLTLIAMGPGSVLDNNNVIECDEQDLRNPVDLSDSGVTIAVMLQSIPDVPDSAFIASCANSLCTISMNASSADKRNVEIFCVDSTDRQCEGSVRCVNSYEVYNCSIIAQGGSTITFRVHPINCGDQLGGAVYLNSSLGTMQGGSGATEAATESTTELGGTDETTTSIGDHATVGTNRSLLPTIIGVATAIVVFFLMVVIIFIVLVVLYLRYHSQKKNYFCNTTIVNEEEIPMSYQSGGKNSNDTKSVTATTPSEVQDIEPEMVTGANANADTKSVTATTPSEVQDIKPEMVTGANDNADKQETPSMHGEDHDGAEATKDVELGVHEFKRMQSQCEEEKELRIQCERKNVEQEKIFEEREKQTKQEHESFIAELQQRHDEERKSLQQEFSERMEELQKQLAIAKDKLCQTEKKAEQEKKDLEKIYKLEIQHLQEQLDKLRSDCQRENDQLKSNHEEELERRNEEFENKFASMRKEHEAWIKSYIEQQMHKRVLEFKKKVVAMNFVTIKNQYKKLKVNGRIYNVYNTSQNVEEAENESRNESDPVSNDLNASGQLPNNVKPSPPNVYNSDPPAPNSDPPAPNSDPSAPADTDHDH